jgi:hypothetical protein
MSRRSGATTLVSRVFYFSIFIFMSLFSVLYVICFSNKIKLKKCIGPLNVGLTQTVKEGGQRPFYVHGPTQKV